MCKLRRRSDSGCWITNTEYPMYVRSESRKKERTEEEIKSHPSNQIAMRSEPLDLEDTWREINILLTHELEKSKVRVVGTRDMRSCEMI